MCFPFFTSQDFTKFSSQLSLSCFAIFTDWKEAGSRKRLHWWTVPAESCRSRCGQRRFQSTNSQTKIFLVVQGAVPASGADPIPWPGCLVGRIPGICCIQECSDAASMLPQLSIPLLSLNPFSFLFGLRMSQEKIAFFPLLSKQKTPGLFYLLLYIHNL